MCFPQKVEIHFFSWFFHQNALRFEYVPTLWFIANLYQFRNKIGRGSFRQNNEFKNPNFGRKYIVIFEIELPLMMIA